MHTQWYAIANPTAGKGLVRKRWAALQQQVAKAIPVGEFALSEYKGHAIELAQRAVEMGYRKILAIGGDGTNHEVANGILRQQAAPSSEVTYALLPIGTGNDWIKTYGFPKSIDKALAVIQAGRTGYQDAGLIHYYKDGQPRQRFFVNVAGLAYDGYIGRKSEERRYATRNKLFYLILVVSSLFEYKLQRAIVEGGGRRIEGHFYTINLGICRYSGGGMQLVPHARPDDGQFAVTTAGRLSKLGVLLNTYRFYNGSIGSHPKVETFQAVSLQVEAAEGAPPTLLEADGEFLGETPARFSIIRKALCIIVP
ncbi:MAG: diacylglycerol kinase family lipid kinase [Phaeodactylibacter sp.]|nr:diacylglycerol kinase family lipid kinase [Phaeodactylibacter sp.]MCB9051527.1 diacylglycerol kinase family lipid kinase [Lewinellaceae bacterium]